MSLNGLDAADVQAAHEAAVAEPGGWFLLQYASRDEVGLLGRGTGGIVEIRNAIAQYDEASPLYGFLKYRRRNVIIKYLPENCSRLVQARVAVHFNAVCERFAPYNITFAMAAAKELKDTKLSAACSLHTASSSTSSSTSSLRRRRLMEIAEEEEEEQRATKRQSVVKEEEGPPPASAPAPAPAPASASASASASATAQPVTLDAQLATAPDASQFAGTAEPPSFTGAADQSSSLLDGRRLSAQLGRPDLYPYSASVYGKPKVKLAPRPSLDVAGRPRTSAGTGANRPVSAIPAGFKLFSKGSRKGRDAKPVEGSAALPEGEAEDGNGKGGKDGKDEKGEKEKEKPDTTPLSAAEIAAIPVPADPSAATLGTKRPHTSSGGRPTSSSGMSVKSVATVGNGSHNSSAITTKQTAMTPEKARLMKAMKLRERKKKMSIQPRPPIPTVDGTEATSPAASESAPPDTPHTPNTPDAPDAPDASDAPDEPSDSSDAEAQGPHDSDATISAGPADSAIDVGLSDLSAADQASAVDQTSTVDQASINTQTTDSHPASPLAMASEIGTKASSLSESTDETVQALQELKAEESAGGGALPEAADANDDAAVHSEQETSVGKDKEDEPEQEKPEEPEEIKECEEPELPQETSKGESSNEEPPAPEEASIDARTASPVSDDAPDQADRTPTMSAIPIPTINIAQRDSQSTIGLESTDAAPLDVKRARRKALVEPIRTDVASLSDDEDLMDELQSATVEEAKPITVSKSPINAVFPCSSPTKQARLGSSGSSSVHSTSGLPSASRVVRTVSSPIRGPLLVPGDAALTSAARSVSSGAAFLHKMAQQNPGTLAPKKSNIGSSISQRIKALEKLSAAAPGQAAENPAPRPERPTSTFFSVRKTSGRDTSSTRSPLIAERASTITRDNTPSPPNSQQSSPEMPKLAPRDRSGSVASRLSVFEGGSLPRGRPESVQVRARIIRDPLQPFPKMLDGHFDPSDLGPLNLKQSPLVVDHQRATTGRALSSAGLSSTSLPQHPLAAAESSVSRRESIQERRMSKEKRRSMSQDGSTNADDSESTTRPRRRSSLSIVKDFIKDRRGSVLGGSGGGGGGGGRAASTDNLAVSNLASPASFAASSKSPSRPPSVHATHGLVRRLSISSRRSTSKDRELGGGGSTSPLNTPLSPSLMTETSGSGDESRASSSHMELGHRATSSGSASGSGTASGSGAGGNKNRASRFMRRLSSSLGGGNRKTLTPTISPTVAEEEEGFGIPPSRASSSAFQPSIVSYIGDVNVQFPDNLLWKRRTMCLDSLGFLILSTGNGATASSAASMVGGGGDRPGGAVKRYHLCDFRQPYVPEMEVQELPNSVCLDFVDGSGLQVACEDRAGQMNVLHKAHQQHTAFGQ